MSQLSNKKKQVKYLDRSAKYEIICSLYGCKTFDDFNERCKEMGASSKLYAQCWWLCKRYQFSRDKDKLNKLKNIANMYGFDLEKIKEFVSKNPKNNDLDRHLYNIFNLDEKIHNQAEEQATLDFIGDAVDIVAIENPSVYDGDKNIDRFVKAYQYNYAKTHLEQVPVIENAFGHFLKVKKAVLNCKYNAIVLSSHIVESGMFNAKIQSVIENWLGNKYTITKELPTNYSQEVLDKLDENGVIKKGSSLEDKDILIGRVGPLTDLNKHSPEERLLVVIFGDKVKEDVSIINSVQWGTVSDVSLVKENGGMLSSITVDKVYELGIGDKLGDMANNKGQIIEIISPEEMVKRFGDAYDLVANFNLDNYIIRFQPIAKEKLTYSIGEEFGLVYQEPTSYNEVLSPLKLKAQDFDKFAKHNLLEVLSQAIRYSYRLPIDKAIIAKILEKGQFDVDDDSMKTLFYIKNYFYALGIEFNVEKKNHSYELSFKIMTDEEKLKMSKGEIHKPEICNYRTGKPEPDGLFCEKVFGPENDYCCSCGKYHDKKYVGKICERCGVEVTTKDVRSENFGHFNLADTITTFFKNKTDVMLILPPNQRPFIAIGGGRFASSDINKTYQSLINRNNRVKKFLELNFQTCIIENEKKMLQECIENHEKCILKTITDFIWTTINNAKIIYSFKGVGSFDNKLSHDKCLVPEQTLVKIFTPYLARMLKEMGISPKKISEKLKNMDSMVIDLLPQVIKDKKLILFSKAKDGEVLLLEPEPTKANAIIVNEENYNKLNIEDGQICGFMPMTEKGRELALSNLNQGQKNNKTFFHNSEATDLFRDIALGNEEPEKRLVNAVCDGKAEITTCVGKFIVETFFR